MPRAILALSLILLTACGGGSPSGGNGTPTPAPTPTTPSGDWTLSWSDEFDGAAGTSPDAGKWFIETGGNFPNNELEAYTARPSNVAQDGNGNLVITARAETFTGADSITRNYTSARLNTSGRFEPTHGKFDGRMRIPRGKGIWPAFWLLGANIGQVGWPSCGEIDIMENIGNEPQRIIGSLHGPGFFGGNSKSASYTAGAPFADDFHVYGVEWETNAIRWYVDGNLYQTRTPADLGAGQTWAFEHSFFIILNVAVGGDWPGSPDATTSFPQQMAIDYVRVSQR
jgi:beta-glucanase (GH16 family)